VRARARRTANPRRRGRGKTCGPAFELGVELAQIEQQVAVEEHLALRRNEHVARRDAVGHLAEELDARAGEKTRVRRGFERHVLGARDLAEAWTGLAHAVVGVVARFVAEVAGDHAHERTRVGDPTRIAVTLAHDQLARRLAVRVDRDQERTLERGGELERIAEFALPQDLALVRKARRLCERQRCKTQRGKVGERRHGARA
jgi:hypothetical protein